MQVSKNTLKTYRKQQGFTFSIKPIFGGLSVLYIMQVSNTSQTCKTTK